MLLVAVPAEAGRLVVADAAATPGRGAQALRVDRRVMRELRRRDEVVVEAFPLGDGGVADLMLRRVSPLSPRLHVEIVGGQGTGDVRPTPAAYFAGTVRDDPDSRVLLIADRRRVHGFVATHGTVYPFGPDARGRHRSYPLMAADLAARTPAEPFCASDRMNPPGPSPAAAPAADVAGLRIADVAIETDTELRDKFPSDQAALDYLAALLAAANVIYERDVGVRLRLGWVRLWSPPATDPWTKTDPSEALNEVFTYWNGPFNGMYAVSGANDLVHFVSGKDVHGGATFTDKLCNWYWAFGVTQVYGSFDLADPSMIWDVLAFAHEIGHTFGSTHTHCYDPPVDKCFNLESGCYSGPIEVSRGTVMSYCYLQPWGVANVDLTFGATVSARIAQSVAAATCLDTVTTTTATTVTTVATSTTTTTSLPPAGGDADGDGDGIADAADACAATPAGELVDASGCSLCPCDGPRSGGAWPSRARYLRCIRSAVRSRRTIGTRAARRDAGRAARRSSCGR